ncbi:hypothetical protein Cob_v002476 [Colletotrichum orbiculare MAFF 240422]|uniref:Uncharacterized protein n=1 Tax=Colletotrichum orbiculare (strain 104-T / ATCC 96160 / CBS 514.97 / LARS 414 / MAFF 240422) TaxID=1213857 RepID=N4VM51_COLOR|nr:hypothetical protein Cob_v002476 [Colletotrichum orbiculare MAFF 240422]
MKSNIGLVIASAVSALANAVPGDVPSPVTTTALPGAQLQGGGSFGCIPIRGRVRKCATTTSTSEMFVPTVFPPGQNFPRTREERDDFSYRLGVYCPIVGHGYVVYKCFRLLIIPWPDYPADYPRDENGKPIQGTTRYWLPWPTPDAEEVSDPTSPYFTEAWLNHVEEVLADRFPNGWPHGAQIESELQELLWSTEAAAAPAAKQTEVASGFITAVKSD